MESGLTRAIEIMKQNWFRYDTDMSGFLDQNESLQLLNDVWKDLGKPFATKNEFSQFFMEFDVNNDGRISMKELIDFFVKLMNPYPQMP